MKLSLTITDTRVVYEHGSGKETEYTLATASDLAGNREVIAGFLRAVADDIAPTLRAVEGVEL